jgi:hypothetical protein
MRDQAEGRHTSRLLLAFIVAALSCLASAQSATLGDEIVARPLPDVMYLFDNEGSPPPAPSLSVVHDSKIPNHIPSSSGAMSTLKPESTVASETASLDGNAIIRMEESASEPVEWKSLVLHSNVFLGIMHAFRMGTEPSTRHGLHSSVFGGYFKSLGAMHGWSDGDGYYENYLGHPIQGAASAYLWLAHDPRYRTTQFGLSRDYWMGRIRAMGFAWAFSEQFEIGPISEASIGQIQRYCCAYGFVDHVITPTAGLAWIIGGDVLDKYLTRKIEHRTRNRAIRMIARIGLNPPQSFANVIAFHPPWDRTNRPGIVSSDGELYLRPAQPPRDTERSQVPKFELAAELPGTLQWGSGSCLGGGAVGAVRLRTPWQWTFQVGGCSLRNMPNNWSGDSLTFSTGPQWIIHGRGRWSPHAHVRLGGQKVTQEYVDPVIKEAALSELEPGEKSNSAHAVYAKNFEATGFSMSVGGGVDLALNRALAVRIGNVEYVGSWLGRVNGADFDRAFRFSSGIVLRIGTW